jgi:indole-3-glycerol phosphate synthase
LTVAVSDILNRIVARKREELAQATATPAELARRAEAWRPQRRDFRAAIERASPAIIAEIKKASPSKGVLVADFDPPRLAAGYARGGAAALSVLTDTSFFQGSLADLENARAAVELPVLRKDFTLEEFHVLEAAAHGADAILLIAAILDERRLRELREAAARWGMAALVEVHDARELDAAVASGAEIIGVNNRNLTTFEVTLETSLRLAECLPADVLRVSESGIHSAADISRLQAAGYHAFLVGEHLMRAGQPEHALRALVSPA